MTEISPLARELRLAREAAGVSIEKAAEMMNVSASLISQVERGKVPVSKTYARAAQIFPPAEGYWQRMQEDALRRPVISEWLRSWLEIETQADTIRWYEPLLVPGLLQVEGYARELLDTEEQVRARMARKEVFTRDHPPDAVFIIDEAVLGSHLCKPAVMVEQLQHLLEAPAVVQVVPAETDIPAGLSGAFVVATVGERQFAFLTAPGRGFVLEDRAVISQEHRNWDVLGREALTPRQSRDLILRVAEEWKNAS